MEVSPFNINTSSEGNMDGVSGVVFGKDWREERKDENNILEIIHEVSSKIEKKRPILLPFFCFGHVTGMGFPLSHRTKENRHINITELCCVV